MACELLAQLDAAAARARRHLVPGQLHIVASFLEQRHGGVRPDGSTIPKDVFGGGAFPVALIPKELVADATQLRDAFAMTFVAVEELPPVEDFLGTLQLANKHLLSHCDAHDLDLVQPGTGGTVVFVGEVSAVNCEDAAKVIQIIHSRGLLARLQAEDASEVLRPAVALVLSDAFCETIVEAKLRVACSTVAVVHLFSCRGSIAAAPPNDDAGAGSYCAQPGNHLLSLFLFEAVAVAPVLLDGSAWAAIQQAWGASHRLLDVVLLLHSMLMPFRASSLHKANKSGAPRIEDAESDAAMTPPAPWNASLSRDVLNECYAHAHRVARGNVVAEAIAFATLFAAFSTTDSAVLLAARVGAAAPSTLMMRTDEQLHAARLKFSDYVKGLTTSGLHELSFSPIVSPQVSIGRYLARVVARGVRHPSTEAEDEDDGAKDDKDVTSESLGFFDPFVSDAVRILYVLISVAGSRVASQRWASFQTLCAVCCGGDDARLLAALKELRVARLATLNLAKRAARSLISL